jgi:hypothetical protein
MAAPGADADTFFHLRFGSEFLGGWAIDAPGHLGAFDSASWIPTQWVSQVGMRLTEDWFGLNGVMWLAGTLAMVLLVLVYRTNRQVAAPLPAAIATAVCYIAAAPGLSARPQLLSYVFIAIVANAWLATARDGQPRYWLVLIAWVWPTLHGMWPFGIMLGVVTIIGMALDRRGSWSRLARLATIPVVSVVLSAATPLGLDAYRSLAVVGSRSDYFSEWGPPDFTSLSSFVLALMIAVAIVLMLVRPAQTSWTDALILGTAAAWALFTVRTGPAAAIVAAPFLATAIQTYVPDNPGLSRRETSSVLVLAVLSSAVLAVGLGARTPREVVPEWLDRRLDTLPAQTRVLNEWDAGAYFLWRHPQLELVMHGYGDVFTDSELRRNSNLIQLNSGWDREVADLDAEYALVSTDSRLAYALVDQLGWEVSEEDDDYQLLVPPGGG